MTNIFYPSRGSRQGCLLSPYVFIICAEILGFLIRNTKHIEGIRIDRKEFLVNQYADDRSTIIILSYSEENLRNIVTIFERYAEYSGLKINYDKSQIMPLGPIKYEYDILAPESNFERCEGPIKSLGVDLCHKTEDLLKLNNARSLGKVKTELQIWDKRYLTILSQLVYLMLVLPSPTEEFLIQIHCMIFN